MSKYVTVGTPQKTVGAYLRVINALNALQALGEEVGVHYSEPALSGFSGIIRRNDETGEWTFVQA